jgi:hypothetical protein
MAVNKPLAPADGLTIRQPTDGGLVKGNIHNPPRYANLGIGGLDSGSARGMVRNTFKIEPPGRSLRKEPNRPVTSKG